MVLILCGQFLCTHIGYTHGSYLQKNYIQCDLRNTALALRDCFFMACFSIACVPPFSFCTPTTMSCTSWNLLSKWHCMEHRNGRSGFPTTRLLLLLRADLFSWWPPTPGTGFLFVPYLFKQSHKPLSWATDCGAAECAAAISRLTVCHCKRAHCKVNCVNARQMCWDRLRRCNWVVTYVCHRMKYLFLDDILHFLPARCKNLLSRCCCSTYALHWLNWFNIRS